MNGDLRTCRSCRRMFYDYVGRHLCPECAKKEEDDFKKVKDYLWEHKNSTLYETSEACDVDPATIRQWLREERLTFTGSGDTGLACESCGTAILSGQYCPECRAKLVKELGSIERQKEAPVRQVVKDNRSRMRFL